MPLARDEPLYAVLGTGRGAGAGSDGEAEGAEGDTDLVLDSFNASCANIAGWQIFATKSKLQDCFMEK